VDYDVLHEVTGSHVADLTALLEAQWWCKGRSEAQVSRMLAASDAVAAVVDRTTGRLVGFARALSDGLFRAHVYDVAVAAGHRGRGLGRRVMEAVLADPRVAGAEVVHLDCMADVAPFYERLGFGSSGCSRGMERARPGFTIPRPPAA
jgi:ribosomal protein S18 acetylase RimI-like enzyme